MNSGTYVFPSNIEHQDYAPYDSELVSKTCRIVVLLQSDRQSKQMQMRSRTIADALVGYMAFRFEQCMSETEQNVIRDVSQLIECFQENSMPSEKFSGTLIASAMDNQGRSCLFHLGEGFIMGKLDPSSEWMVLSYPETALDTGTALVPHDRIFDRLRFYRLPTPGDHRFMLFTGEVFDLFSSEPSLLDHPDLLSNTAFVPKEDCSVAWLMAGTERKRGVKRD